MNKKIRNTFLAVALTPCLAATPVSAAPSVEELEGSKAQAESEAAALQDELTGLLTKINELEGKLIENGEKLLQTEEDLSAAEEKEAKQYAEMKTRIKYMYEGGQTDALELLFSAESFPDFLNKAEYASMIHTYDRQKISELQETQEEIKNLKTSLEEEQKALSQAQADYTKQEASVNAQLDAKRSEVANFDVLLQAAVEAAAAEAEQQAEEQKDEADSPQESDDKNEQNGAQSEEKDTEDKTTSDQNNPSSDQKPETGSSSDKKPATDSSSDKKPTTDSSSDKKPETGSSSDKKPSTDSSSDKKPSSGSSSGSSSTNTSSSSKAQQIVNAAYSQLGVKYVYGGTKPGVGLDCSGLVQYAHRMAGISLPRTSGDQGASGVAVSSPKPGDIVCYVGHVGIYIGNGKMIHAPEPGDVVKISSVYGSPWYRRCW